MSSGAGSTWSGTHRFSAVRLHTPRTIDEVQRVVAGTERLRALGTRHSFNDIADGHEMLTVTGLELEPEIDQERGVVWVAAGSSYGRLASWLTSRGFALHNLGSLPHISIGGATSTGTHGSGTRNGNLATAVRSVEIVVGGGELLRLDDGHPDFRGAVVTLGSLGIAVRMALAVEPVYDVRQDVYRGLSWDALLADPSAVFGAGYSVSVYTGWVGDTLSELLVKRRVRGDDRSPTPTRIADSVIDSSTEPLAPNFTPLGVVGPWSDRLPHYRLDSPPSYGDEIQSEYFVDLRHAATALRLVRELGEDIAPALIGSELRTVAADSHWLSPAYGRDSLAIHFTWRNDLPAVRALVPRIEQQLAAVEARPHWGKVFGRGLQRDTLAPLYPEFGRFLDLAARLDPEGRFRNDYTSRVLGLGWPA